MSYPLVTVGLPVFNGEKWVSRALDSLIRQDYENIQIIISENSSEDHTYKICAEYAKSFDNIEIIRQDKTVDIFDNFRAVLEPAEGEYFMWAAVDDSWSPSFISKLVEKLESDNTYAVAQSATLLYSESELRKPIGRVGYSGKNNLDGLTSYEITRKILSPPKYNYYIYGLFRKDLLEEAFRFMPNVPSSDRLFLLQFPLAGYKMAYVDEPLYIRTIADLPSYLRYKGDAYCDQVGKACTKWFDYSGVAAIQTMFSHSTLLKQCSSYCKNIILYQYISWKLTFGLRLMTNSLIVKFLPKAILQKIRRVIKRRDYM